MSVIAQWTSSYLSINSYNRTAGLKNARVFYVDTGLRLKSTVPLAIKSVYASYAACKRRTNAWPSGLCTPSGFKSWNEMGSTVFRSQPSSSMLPWMRRSARLAAGIDLKSCVNMASRYVTAAIKAVEAVSPKVL